MATSKMEKKGCFKCEKGAGIFTCNGCQQSFCRKHSEEHRTELATQMDFIGQEYDLFRRDMDAANGEGTLLVQIDVWEQESIFRIKQAAESARRDLRRMASGRVKLELKSSMDQMSKEIQSSRESEDYMEGDLVQWINQLNQCRKELEELESLSLIDDGNESSIIRLIKMIGLHYSLRSDRMSRMIRPDTNQTLGNNDCEKFAEGDKRITLSTDGFAAVFSGLQTGDCAAVLGTRHYLTGTDCIWFRVEKLNGGDITLGIMTSSHTDPTSVFTSSNGVYGWYTGHFPVANNLFQSIKPGEQLRDGDEVGLILYCQESEILLQHRRTKRIMKLSVNPQHCPLPWKTILILYNQDSRVSILQRSNAWNHDGFRGSVHVDSRSIDIYFPRQ